jgi:phosphate transport system ATP-binding protein
VSHTVEISSLSAYYGDFLAVADVSLTIEPRSITAFIGPSGCGKSTLLRAINRMHEVIPGGRVTGGVLVGGEDVYGAGIDPVLVRQRVGMVFQRPNPFPTMTVRENVLAGVRLQRRRMSRGEGDAIVERALRSAGLWTEVRDRLGKSGAGLSGGQQQRLCIARAIAVEPEVVLMDEPCSALDPVSTLAIEDLMADLKASYTVVIVTHNMAQAARISDHTAFFSIAGARQPGRLIEHGDTHAMFHSPTQRATEDYIAGRFG